MNRIVAFISLLSACATSKLPPEVFRGMTYGAFDQSVLTSNITAQAMKEMQNELSVAWLSLTILWKQDGVHANTVYAYDQTPSDDWIRGFIQQANQLDLAVMIKPIIVPTGNASVFITPTNFSEWFSSYSKLMLSLAQLAAQEGAEAISIGVELPFVTIPPNNRESWISLILQVRQVFSGSLTFSALYVFEYPNLSFWDALDWIGIDAYFPLAAASNPNPPLSEMIATLNQSYFAIREWKSHLPALLNIPVVFTEIGFPSTQYCAALPAGFPTSGGCSGIFAPNNTCQQSAWETVFELLPSYSDIISGLFVFWWDNPSTPDLMPSGKWYPCYFTPRGKPAYDIIQKAFSSL